MSKSEQEHPRLPPGFLPAAGGTEVVEDTRSGWLFAITAIGILMVGGSIWVALHTSVSDIWSDVLLNVGSGVLLFALLFLAERRLVIRQVAVQTRLIVEALRGDLPLDNVDLAGLAARSGEDEQVGVARRFFEAVVSGDVASGWALADANWRLCRAQAWLWNNRDHYGNDLDQLQTLADDLVENGEQAEAWALFRRTERHQFREVWKGTSSKDFGVGSTRRIVAPAYEIVLFVPITGFPDGLLVHEATLVEGAVPVLVHLEDERWRAAAFQSEVPPTPGWPPSWWIRHDPVAEAWFAERESGASLDPSDTEGDR